MNEVNVLVDAIHNACDYLKGQTCSKLVMLDLPNGESMSFDGCELRLKDGKSSLSIDSPDLRKSPEILMAYVKHVQEFIELVKSKERDYRDEILMYAEAINRAVSMEESTSV